MLDRDLAEMYQVETRVLNQAVKRNIERFSSVLCFNYRMMNRVRETGLFPVSTSHTTVRAVRHTAVPYLRYDFTITIHKKRVVSSYQAFIIQGLFKNRTCGYAPVAFAGIC